MKKVLFVILLVTASCSNIRDTKISAPDSHKVLNKICQELDKESAEKLKRNYRYVLMDSEESKNRKYIIEDYGIRYEDITFQDLIEYKNNSELKKN